MKELPKIFKNEINKTIKNNEEVFYGKVNEDREDDRKSVNQKINSIFSSPNYIYKANVTIVTNDKTISKKIIGRNKEYLITMDNDLIPVKDIIDIKINKK